MTYLCPTLVSVYTNIPAPPKKANQYLTFGLVYSPASLCSTWLLCWTPTYTCALPKTFPVSGAEQMRNGLSFLLLSHTLQLQGPMHQLTLCPLIDFHAGRQHGTELSRRLALGFWTCGRYFLIMSCKTNHTRAVPFNKSARKH